MLFVMCDSVEVIYTKIFAVKLMKLFLFGSFAHNFAYNDPVSIHYLATSYWAIQNHPISFIVS